MSTSDVIAGDGETLTLEQSAAPASFLGLSLRNGLLNLITLTLYRFWGKTEVRRRLWSTTCLNNEPFEYTGRGVELFLGFLIALLVIGAPFLLVVFGAQFLGPILAGVVLLPVYLFMGFLLGFGRFTAFRYLATRTSWRGVRFLLEGSPVGYGFKYIGYAWLSGLTLGWFWPAAQRRLAEPLWGGLRFGDRRFRFDLDAARREQIYGPYAIGWVGLAVSYFVAMGALVSLLSGAARGAGASTEQTLAQLGMIYLVAGLMVLAGSVLFAPYHAAMLRSVAAGISFDEVRFRLKLKWWDMAWLTLSNLALLTVSLGFLMPFVEARTLKFLIGRLEALGAVDFASVRQVDVSRPRTGEGLADAFGVVTI